MGRRFGDGTTDYEKYIRTSDIYALMKDESEWVNEDELLFQATHQQMEIWLAVVVQHLDQAAAWMNEDRVRDATRFLNRAASIVDLLISSLRPIESMSPWSYHAIRVTLGEGSGQQSPTFNQLLETPKETLEAFNGLLERRGVSLLQIQTAPSELDDLWQLATAMLLFDENFMRWRYIHFQMVKRIIGDRVLSLAGVPASALAEYAFKANFKALWDSVADTTEAYNKAHGAPGKSGAYTVIPETE